MKVRNAKMINPQELKICKERGHQVTSLDEDWLPCLACGMWVREVRTIEEREDEPPVSERSVFWKLRVSARRPRGDKTEGEAQGKDGE